MEQRKLCNVTGSESASNQFYFFLNAMEYLPATFSAVTRTDPILTSFVLIIKVENCVFLFMCILLESLLYFFVPTVNISKAHTKTEITMLHLLKPDNEINNKMHGALLTFRLFVLMLYLSRRLFCGH